ncbi:MAG: DUF998 domain-containing protein [Chloroflexi bacterium]|nr:DUF998 domain-containing protein [Chloroflexota bacterium]MBU1746619.1 DUF998 domain-containing protein [Chloroflexota bacterium]MBU1877495.1 DUF998 domain-containing protein [Chloroflexota bacterium]
MKIDARKLTYICGLAGPVIIILSSLVTALVYHGKLGEPYSFLNHFISELGEVGVSTLAPVFNICLFASGLILAVFMLGLGLYIRTKLGYLAAAVGIYSGVSCSLVGVFPMNHLSIHTTVAYSFFFSGLVAIALFTLAIVLDKQHKLSKWFVVPGLITMISFASFLLVATQGHSGRAQTLAVNTLARPTIWLTPLLEWSIFFTVLAWVLLVAVYLMVKKPAALGSG